jgi:MFS family permease
LPARIADLTGSDDVVALSYATFAGAIVASFANVGFGWLSDRFGGRPVWIVAGLLISSGLLVAVHEARTLVQLIAVIMAWQLGLNMMLGPLAAWAGDCVPDGQKGLLGGLFAFAPALGALAGAIVTTPGLAASADRLAIVALLVLAMVSPVLLLGRGRELPQLMQAVTAPPDREQQPWRTRSAVLKMWFARLLVQIAEAALFAFLLFWLRSLAPGYGENNAARIFSIVLAIAVPLALVAGRWSDRTQRPMLPLAIAAALSACGLVAMALAHSLELAIAGYVLFGVTSVLFLSLHSSQTLRVLPRPQTRGRDLGLFNLTNTVPSLIIPWLTLSLVPIFGFSGLFWVLAGLCALASSQLIAISRRV